MGNGRGLSISNEAGNVNNKQHWGETKSERLIVESRKSGLRLKDTDGGR